MPVPGMCAGGWHTPQNLLCLQTRSHTNGVPSGVNQTPVPLPVSALYWIFQTLSSRWPIPLEMSYQNKTPSKQKHKKLKSEGYSSSNWKAKFRYILPTMAQATGPNHAHSLNEGGMVHWRYSRVYHIINWTTLWVWQVVDQPIFTRSLLRNQAQRVFISKWLNGFATLLAFIYCTHRFLYNVPQPLYEL